MADRVTFRGKLQGGLLPVIGVANALTARIVEDVGFEAGYVSGAGIANTYLGVPDIGLVTMSELVQHVDAITDRVSIPLAVDADTGFGNPINVMRTVAALERAGAQAIQLEDQEFPKRCGHFPSKQVIPTVEMVQKIRAAVAARTDPDTMIIARTDALASLGFDEAIERARRYVDAGADMTFVEAPTSVDQLEKIPRLIDAPQVVNLVIGGKTPVLPFEELQELGFSVALYANLSLQGAMLGTQRALSALRESGSLEEAYGDIVDWQERQRLVGLADYEQLEFEFGVS
ncbi:MAG TPA: isocitrate lyase/PEP mutase family protein [Galbitalea sp.]